MDFHEVRLPEDIERGVSGGPRFNTEIVTLASGFEQRNAQWIQARGEWNVGYGIRDEVSFSNVQAFFNARMGRLFGFRFRDFSDFKVENGFIGTGNGTQTRFQAQKVYESGGFQYVRPIQKISQASAVVSVADTPPAIFVNGVEESNVSIDVDTGIITFSSAPANGAVITASFMFDVPVRFDVDNLSVALVWLRAGEVPSLPVIEIRIPLEDL